MGGASGQLSQHAHGHPAVGLACMLPSPATEKSTRPRCTSRRVIVTAIPSELRLTLQSGQHVVTVCAAWHAVSVWCPEKGKDRSDGWEGWTAGGKTLPLSSACRYRCTSARSDLNGRAGYGVPRKNWLERIEARCTPASQSFRSAVVPSACTSKLRQAPAVANRLEGTPSPVL